MYLGSTEIVKGQVSGDATFYLVPTVTLPLLDPLLDGGGVPQSVLNIVQPALQVIVEALDGRSIPFADPTPFELIPSIDPVTFTLELDNGIIQGANNAFGLSGSELPGFDQMESFFTLGRDVVRADHRSSRAPRSSPNATPVSTRSPWPSTWNDPIGEAIEDVLTATGVQQDLLDPILGLPSVPSAKSSPDDLIKRPVRIVVWNAPSSAPPRYNGRAAASPVRSS